MKSIEDNNMSQIQYTKEWLGEQIHAMECQFLFHKDSLGVQDLDGIDYNLED